MDNLLSSAVEAALPRRLAEEGASFHQHLFSKLDRYKLANLAGWNKYFAMSTPALMNFRLMMPSKHS
jgi:hypothetical protein